MFQNRGVPSVGTEAQITYNDNKKTIQPNNKAPRRSPSFGSIMFSFVVTVPAKRPNLGMGKLGYTGLSLRAESWGFSRGY